MYGIFPRLTERFQSVCQFSRNALRPWPLNDLSDAEWCPGCKAHYGFAGAYDELRDDVHTAIQELNCTRLVLSDHSLGAAIATIATFDLLSAMGYKVDARIGNAEFVNSFEAMWRVVHYHDPVPRAPPNFFRNASCCTRWIGDLLHR